MNLIICDQNCQHQEDGYCALNHIAKLTSDLSARCGYFEAQATTRATPAAGEPPAPAKR